MSSDASTALSRLRKDYLQIKKDPLPYVTAEPLPTNLLEWHYVINGPPETPYQGGFYHGKLKFPPQYPYRPPSIFMITPNGRFKTNCRLCLSMSDYHPDTWNPSWTVSTILAGLLSFMLETTDTLGAIETTTVDKMRLAQDSLRFNIKNSAFLELFPEMAEQISRILTTQELESPSSSQQSKGSLLTARFKKYIDYLKAKITRRGT